MRHFDLEESHQYIHLSRYQGRTHQSLRLCVLCQKTT
jgi:hypothetical protein